MPFKSERQREYMHKNHPEIAKRWEEETPKGKLPERVKPKAKNKSEHKRIENQKKGHW